MEHKIVEEQLDIKPGTTELGSEYDPIDFYLQPEFIKAISQQIANQPQIDHARVAKIKHDIANDVFNLNVADLSEKIIKFESELFKK